MSSRNSTGVTTALLQRLFPRLRYPWLFAVVGGLFLLDLIMPDPVPLIDEAMLGLLTVLLGSWKTRNQPPKEPEGPVDVTDRGSDR